MYNILTSLYKFAVWLTKDIRRILSGTKLKFAKNIAPQKINFSHKNVIYPISTHLGQTFWGTGKFHVELSVTKEFLQFSIYRVDQTFEQKE